MSNKEKASNFQAVVDVFPNRGVIEIVNASEPSKENKKMFTYDAVYNEKGSQQMIYDEVVRPLVSSVRCFINKKYLPYRLYNIFSALRCWKDSMDVFLVSFPIAHTR